MGRRPSGMSRSRYVLVEMAGATSLVFTHLALRVTKYIITLTPHTSSEIRMEKLQLRIMRGAWLQFWTVYVVFYAFLVLFLSAITRHSLREYLFSPGSDNFLIVFMIGINVYLFLTACSLYRQSSKYALEPDSAFLDKVLYASSGIVFLLTILFISVPELREFRIRIKLLHLVPPALFAMLWLYSNWRSRQVDRSG